MQEQICWVVVGALAASPLRTGRLLAAGRDCSAVKTGLCCSNAGLLCCGWTTYDGNCPAIIPPDGDPWLDDLSKINIALNYAKLFSVKLIREQSQLTDETSIGLSRKQPTWHRS